MQKKLIIHFFVQSIQKQGTYFRFHNLALGLAGLGHTVRVFGAAHNKGEKSRKEKIDGIDYYITACYFPLRRFFGQYQHPIGALKRMFKRYPPCDVAHLFQPHLSAYLPWYYNRKKAKVNVYDWDDLWTNGLVKKGLTIYEKWLYWQVNYIEKKAPKRCNFITTCSKFLLDKGNDLGALRSEIIYNGYWIYIPNSKAASRTNMKLSQNAFYVGFMGRTVKEINWCFDLLKCILERFSHVRLALCGMPAEVFDNMEEHLRKKIDYLGFLPPEATRDFASAIDVGLLPLENDAFNQSRFPIKFAEYLAAGTPVVCTDVGECAQIAQRFSFVKISPSDKESWIIQATDVVFQIMNNNWPVVDKQQIEGVLNWTNISKKLEQLYLHDNS